MAKATLISWNSLSLHLLFQVHLHPIHSHSFKNISMNSRLSLWDCDLQNFGPKAKNRRLFLLAPVCVCRAVTTQGPTASGCQPWCLHIFAAVATNIAETRGDGSNQVWSQLMTHINHYWYHSSSKAHVMGSCGTAVGAILLKELLGHGLATHNEHDSAVLGTLDSLLGDSSKLAKGITLCAAKLNG